MAVAGLSTCSIRRSGLAASLHPLFKTTNFKAINIIFPYLSSIPTMSIVCAAIDVVDSTLLNPEDDDDFVPMPFVLIDQDVDSDATVVKVSFGDRLGALIDTECSEQLAMGEAFGIKAPEKKVVGQIETHIHLKKDGPKRSMLYIETVDRPGLLLEVIKVIADVNIAVESAEIKTDGLVAKDKFHVSYGGAALNSSLSQVLVNCLRYYLRRPDTDDGSY